MTAPRRRCDCLVYCVDDPDLVRGKAAPCDALETRRLQIARAARIADLLRVLGYADELTALEAFHAARAASRNPSPL